LQRAGKEKDQRVKIAVLRKGEPLEFTVKPECWDSADGKPVYRIAWKLPSNSIDKLRFAAALNAATVDCKKIRR